MAVRLIDGNVLKQWCEKIIDQACHPATVQIGEAFLDKVRSMPTLTPPNEWVSVDEKLPEPGERVLATDCGFVGEFYINKRGKWQRYNVNCYELLMALDILYWMPLPAPPDKDNNVLAKMPNEPLTLEQLRQMDGEPVWIVDIGGRNWYGPGWAIVDRENNLVRTVKNWNPVFFEKYGERWLAYCRPPEGEEDA